MTWKSRWRQNSQDLKNQRTHNTPQNTAAPREGSSRHLYRQATWREPYDRSARLPHNDHIGNQQRQTTKSTHGGGTKPRLMTIRALETWYAEFEAFEPQNHTGTEPPIQTRWLGLSARDVAGQTTIGGRAPPGGEPPVVTPSFSYKRSHADLLTKHTGMRR